MKKISLLIIGILFAGYFAYSQSYCQASFYFAVDSNNANTVYFYDQSTSQSGNVISYYWNFGFYFDSIINKFIYKRNLVASNKKLFSNNAYSCLCLLLFYMFVNIFFDAFA